MAAADPTELAAWEASVLPADRISMHGMPDRDAEGLGSGAIVYVAPGIIGLLAEVAAHSALVSGRKSAQRAALEAKADEVLKPYQPVIDQLTPDALIALADTGLRAQGLRAVTRGADAGAGEIKLAPVFFMTPDQRALVMEGAVEVHPAGTTRSSFAGVVRIVGAPRPPDPDGAAWLANDGATLRQELALLLRESIALAIRTAAHADDAPTSAPTTQTFRYLQGGTGRAERGSLLEAGCDRLVLRTLRGVLFSVPLEIDSKFRAPQCAGAS